MLYDSRHGVIWRAFVLVSWCLLGMACSADAVPEEQPAGEAARVASLPKQPAQQAAPASTDWTAEVQKRMANGERAIRADGTNAFRVVNRKQGLAAKVDSSGGLHIEPRAGGASSVHVQLASVGREGAPQPVGVTSLALGACGSDGAVDEMGACLKRLEVQRAGVVEWWESRENGLEQGFVVENRPAGKGLLELHVAVEGAQVEVSGEHATGATLRVDERTAWEYAGLSVVDARGQQLESWMERDDLGGVRIVVEDDGAVYPVVVDPVLGATAHWRAESNQHEAYFGVSVASAGDVNGDGFGDVIVGAPSYDNSSIDEGRVYVYLGSIAGLGTTAAWTAEADQASASFGVSVASAGDVNGDGFGDVIVGAHSYDNGETDEGRAYVYLGSAKGLLDPATNPPWTAESDRTNASFGISVASAGDVNGDGYSDVIVGASGYNNRLGAAGRVYVYLGSASGLQYTNPWMVDSDQANAQFGYSVASAGDINGDGYSDVIVGAPLYDNGEIDAGRVYVYLGSASGLQYTNPWMVYSDQANASFGYSVASAGDVNGDGYGDVIAGAPLYDNGSSIDEGRAFVYLGSAAGLATTAAWTAEPNQAFASFGISVASAGDVNGDGFGDVIVGASKYDNPQINEGRAFVYLGSPGELGTTSAWNKEGSQHWAYFGTSVASAGDVNGDGYGDVIIGTPNYDNGSTNEGCAYVYLGSASNLGATQVLTAESNQFNARFGWSVASAGDVNSDGYGDVIVGAYFYDNNEDNEGGVYVYLGSANGLGVAPVWMAESNQIGAQFGWSVASAGDVNGDGFGDIIVGAPYYDNGTIIDAGRVYVYLGSASGLATIPAWTAESDQAAAFLGFSVASAGDVNGDGFGDVIVGAVYYDNPHENGGRAYVYLGSANGVLDLPTNPPWTADSDRPDSNFGLSVASAGDVNGDGFGDVIVGAPGYDDAGLVDTGRVYVYLGSAQGLLDPTTHAPWIAKSVQEFASFGWSVASAGDSNGDGYGDVIIGALGYDNAEYMDAGRAYVYVGSASGLGPTVAWTADGAYEEAYLGTSVASAGDVNGDGYGDVIIGAPGFGNGQLDEGHAYVYLGSASGLGTTAGWIATSDQTNALFGRSVASAGDIDGDGFSDVIVGAYKYDHLYPDEGGAFVYSVPSSGRPHLRLFDPAANHPVAPLSALEGSSVRATALGATPFGRVNVKAEVEVKLLGVAFNGQRTTLSPSWTPGFSGGAFQDLVTDASLVQAKPHHLRWRLRYRPSEGRPAVASRWIYPQASGDARGTHFRFGVCGNGLREGDEGCDDGNVFPNDGCNTACKGENGVGCTLLSASSCATGFCADGVCCDNACTGLCSACTAQLKGSGVDGECGYFAEGTDPEHDCAIDAASTCQQDGLCDGNGACRLWARETTCGADACSGNTSKRSFCDGLGTCQLDLIGTDCGANGCNPATGQCITGCTTDADCTADAYCDTSSGQCKPKATLGTTCTTSAQCQSGQCVDGVCCNEACVGLCQACSTAAEGSADGICTAVAVGTSDVACAVDPHCGTTGRCSDAGTCAFAAFGYPCGDQATCMNGIAHRSSCDGQGSCVPEDTSCGNYACDATACKTSCTTNQDCIDNRYCVNGQCEPHVTNGFSCSVDDECQSGHCVTVAGADAGPSKICCEAACAWSTGDACGNTGRCTPTGKCELAPLGKPCGIADCSEDGHRYTSQICNNGNCVADPSVDVDCSPYKCEDARTCKRSCNSDADCLSEYACRNGRCGTKTCDENKKCLEGEICESTMKSCVAAAADPEGCTCQTPGSSSSSSRWFVMSFGFIFYVIRRAESKKSLEMQRSAP